MPARGCGMGAGLTGRGAPGVNVGTGAGAGSTGPGTTLAGSWPRPQPSLPAQFDPCGPQRPLPQFHCTGQQPSAVIEPNAAGVNALYGRTQMQHLSLQQQPSQSNRPAWPLADGTLRAARLSKAVARSFFMAVVGSLK